MLGVDEMMWHEQQLLPVKLDMPETSIADMAAAELLSPLDRLTHRGTKLSVMQGASGGGL